MPNVELLKSIGARIRAVRKAKNVSQERLAELAELHPTYISFMELARVNASISSYSAVAKGLGLTLAELVDVEGGKKSENQLG
jgi:transcriptional regulator with XRE-family HTH domain